MAKLRLVPASGGAIEVGKDEIVIGREPTCDVTLSDASVSRRHAKLEKRGTTWHVVDQGSANGTFLDSQRVAEAALKDGQTLRLGAVDFQVEIEDDLAATIAMPQEPLLARPPAAAPPVAPPAAAPPPMAPRSPAPPAAPAAPRPAASAPPPPPSSRATPPRAAGAGVASPVPPMGPGPGAAPPAKKGKGPLFWGGVACCGCLLLAALGGGGFAIFMKYATEGPVTAVRDMLKALKAGQHQAAYDSLSSGYRARLDPESFAQFVAAHPGLSDNTDSTFSNRSVNNDRAVLKDATLVGGGQTETATFTLIKDGSTWKIDSISFGGSGDGPPGAGSLRLDDASVTKSHDGEMVKVVIDIVAYGYGVRPRPGHDDFALDLIEDVETLGPDGQLIESLSKKVIEHRQSATSESSPPPPQRFSTTLTVNPNNAEGRYTVRCTVRDQIGGGQQVALGFFELP